MPLVEDMAAFFNADEFATPAQLDGVAVLGILDQPYMQALDAMSGTEPVFMLPTADATAARIGVWLELPDGVNYKVRAVEPDGTGVTTLRLTRS